MAALHLPNGAQPQTCGRCGGGVEALIGTSGIVQFWCSTLCKETTYAKGYPYLCHLVDYPSSNVWGQTFGEGVQLTADPMESLGETYRSTIDPGGQKKHWYPILTKCVSFLSPRFVAFVLWALAFPC